MANDDDDGLTKTDKNPLSPLNIKKKPERQTAVALQEGLESGEIARIKAAGRGKIAENILQIAFDNGIKVREDRDLAEMLAKIELDSPIPGEAFMAVAEILSYIYRANGEPDPYNAVLKNAMNQEEIAPDDNGEDPS